MSRYIDADELKDAMLFGMCGTGYQTQALGLIEEVPTADVVEVVRCKYCKYSRVADMDDQEDGYLCSLLRGHEFFSYDYCSYGERK